MPKNKIVTLAIAGLAVAGTVVFASSFTTAFAEDTTSETQTFTERVSEILGLESSEVDSAMTQAREELGYGPGAHMGRGKGMEEIATFTGLSVEEIRDAKHEGDMTLEEALVSLGFTDIDGVKAEVLESKLSHITELEEAGSIDADRAATMRENAEERVENMFSHEPGEMMHEGGRGMGMGRHGGNL